MAATQSEQIKTLTDNFLKLPEKDRAFALSLITQAKKRDLSEKQWFWVTKLVNDVTAPPKSVELPFVGPRDALDALFDKAKKNLKFPSFTLDCPEVGSVEFYRCSSTAMKPNSIAVGQQKKRLGWIVGDRFEWKQGVTESPKLIRFVQVLLNNPVKTVADFGKMSGRCCFCNRVLSDPQSTAAGYGKRCAEVWGLPFGASIQPTIKTAA